MPARPFITLKLATSLDGKIALANGQSEWITSEESRAEGRKLRASHDAIAIGSNTAVIDNPQLTTRIDGEPDPIRIVFDSSLRLHLDSNLVRTAKDTPVWVFCRDAETERAAELKSAHVKLFSVRYDNGLDISEALEVMRRNNIERLLVEGGGTLAASFVKLGVIDRIEWFRAPTILGADGRDSLGPLGLEILSNAPEFERVAFREMGRDLHETYERTG